MTPLCLAAAKGHVKAMKLALRFGADIDAVNFRVSVAAYECSGPMSICACSSIQDDKTALHKAAEAGQFAAVRFLIERKADLSALNKVPECSF